MDICFATNNKNKLREIQLLVPPSVHLLSLNDIGCLEEISETKDTIEGNSLLKAAHVWNKYHANCFADDTGLEVDYLNGAPGVYSARYAGPQGEAKNNIALLLKNLGATTERNARFRTVITLIIDAEVHTFEGILSGKISENPKGNNGFGYDPIFIPQGCGVTFAEMTTAEKNAISHRAIAVNKLIDFLKHHV